jgi:serine/threonine protein kinase
MAKNFDNISCFSCGKANKKQQMICNSCGENLHIQDNFVGINVEGLQILGFIARGFYGLTYKTKDHNGKPFAIKLISKKSYESNGKNFENEASIYAKLPDHPFIARYIRTGEVDKIGKKEKFDFFFIISEWVDGVPLMEWMKNENLTPANLYYLAYDLLNAVQAFEEVQLWHNDLHEENILVSKISRSQQRSFNREIPLIAKIVDIGSAKYKSGSTVKPITDLNYVGKHIFELKTRISYKFYDLSKEDQLFMRMIDALCTRLTDEEISRGFNDADKALTELESIWKASRFSKPTIDQTLEDPFGLINAMDIYSPKLIKEMFSDKFHYFTRIQSMDNQSIVITGPRGCGKTMILKNMSFETIFSVDQQSEIAIDSIEVIGLFLSARIEFANLLIAIRDLKWVKNERYICLYFNVLVTLKIIDLLYSLESQRKEKDTNIQIIIDFINENFNLPKNNLFTCRNHLLKITKAIKLDEESIDIYETSYNSTPIFLNELIELLQNNLSSLQNKTFFLLVDDLSLPRIPEKVIKSLVPFLFNPGSKYKVRVSAHSDGLIFFDDKGEEYKEDRDFIQINLGREYFQMSENYDQCLIAFDDVMNKRFSLAGLNTFPGIEKTLGIYEELINFGSYIKEKADQKKLRTLRYKGSHVFIKLCSGDLSYLVNILGLMCVRWDESKYPIGATIQHDIIKNYARTQLRLLRDRKTEVVTSLYDVGFNFGMISKAHLLHNGNEHLRIEIEIQNLSEDGWTAMRELLSFGLFIDGGFSNTSKGNPARRLLFRRIYTPAFPTTVNNRNTINFDGNSFISFVKNPAQYKQIYLSKLGVSQNKQIQMEFFDD